MRISLYLFKFAIVFLAASLSAAAVRADTYTLDENFGQVPLVFTLNEGQFEPPVKFAVEGNNCNALSDYRNLVLRFKDINLSPEITAEDRVSWDNNYFIGNDPENWRTDVPNYKHIRLHNIYDGIDLTCTGNNRKIDFEILVKPHADPSQIVFNNKDYDGFHVNEQGELVGYIASVVEPVTVKELTPDCYQIIDGKEIPIEIKYKIISKTEKTVSFEFGEYDPGYELVIRIELVDSPLWILKHTTDVSGIDVDDVGNVYVAGKVSFYDFSSLFVLKLNEAGDELGYVTYFGGTGDYTFTHINDFTKDNSDNVYITGWTQSSDFTITNYAFDKIHEGNEGYVTKINRNGNEIIYSTFIGGSKTDYINGIAVDEIGHVYITGFTRSLNYPTTSNVYNDYEKDWKGFVTKLNTEGSDLEYSTFIGKGSPNAITIDGYGNSYITGIATSDEFITTQNSFSENYNGGLDDVFVLKN